MKKRSHRLKVAGMICLVGWIAVAAVFIWLRTSEPYEIDLVGFERTEYGATLARLRFTNNTSTKIEIMRMERQIGGVSYLAPGDGPRHGQLPTRGIGFSGGVVTDWIEVPPHSSVVATDNYGIYGKGERLVAWWQPPTKGAWGRGAMPLSDRIRWKLSHTIHRPDIGHRSVAKTKPAWREQLADRISPRPRLVRSEPFTVE